MIYFIIRTCKMKFLRKLKLYEKEIKYSLNNRIYIYINKYLFAVYFYKITIYIMTYINT